MRTLGRGAMGLFGVLVGCVSGTGVDGFVDAGDTSSPMADAVLRADASQAACPTNPIDLQGAQLVGFRDIEDETEVIGFEAELSIGYVFQLYLYRQDEFATGFYPGNFRIVLEPFCSTCASFESPGVLLQAQSGTVTIDSVSDSNFVGSLRGLSFVQVSTESDRPLAGGCAATFNDLNFDLPFAADF